MIHAVNLNESLEQATANDTFDIESGPLAPTESSGEMSAAEDRFIAIGSVVRGTAVAGKSDA